MYSNPHPQVSVPSITSSPCAETRGVSGPHLHRRRHHGSKPPVSTRDLEAYKKLRSEIKRHGSDFGVNRSPRSSYENIAQFCSACHLVHVPGGCPLGPARRRENCGSCGIAHSGVIRKCPSLASAGQIRYMLDELRNSTEPKERIELERAALVRQLRRKS